MYSMHVNVVVQAWLQYIRLPPRLPARDPETPPRKTEENSPIVSNVEVTSPTYKCRMKEKFICDIFRDICSSMVYLINKKKKYWKILTDSHHQFMTGKRAGGGVVEVGGVVDLCTAGSPGNWWGRFQEAIGQ